MAVSDEEKMIQEGESAVHFPRSLQTKVIVGALVFVSFAGLTAVVSHQYGVTVGSDSILGGRILQRSGCPGGWSDLQLSGNFYIKGWASGPDGNGRTFGLQSAKRACEREPSCTGITCGGGRGSCTLRAGDPFVSPNHEFSYRCNGKVASEFPQFPDTTSFWGRYGTSFTEEATGPGGNGRLMSEDLCKRACAVDPSCKGVQIDMHAWDQNKNCKTGAGELKEEETPVHYGEFVCHNGERAPRYTTSASKQDFRKCISQEEYLKS